MIRAAVIGAAGLVGFAAWEYARRQQQGADVAGNMIASVDDTLTSAATTAAEWIDAATGGLLKMSAMRNIPPAAYTNINVRAFLRVIRVGEGTQDDGGYQRLFGGGKFDGWADHPRVKVQKSGYTSTAAGAYQFLSSTWDETAAALGLRDFSPQSQDKAAVARIAYRGALDDVIAGRFEAAIEKCGKEWASLPGSPYGQPTITMARALGVYRAFGGQESAYA